MNEKETTGRVLELVPYGLYVLGSLNAGANGFGAGLEAGINGLDCVLGGGANGFARPPSVGRESVPVVAAIPLAEPVAATGSQLDRRAFEPRSASSQ